MINKVCACEAQILRLTLGGLQKKNVAVLAEQLEEDGLAIADRENCE